MKLKTFCKSKRSSTSFIKTCTSPHCQIKFRESHPRYLECHENKITNSRSHGQFCRPLAVIISNSERTRRSKKADLPHQHLHFKNRSQFKPKTTLQTREKSWKLTFILGGHSSFLHAGSGALFSR